MSGNGLECLECNLQFASKEELVNHKEKFCVESDWFDPVVMKQTLEAEHAMEVKDRKALTLGEVKDYLKKRTSAANDPHIAGMTLKDMRGEFQKGDKSLEELHQRITRQRHEEKAEELRQLQLRQQQARAEKNKEERELRDLMLNLEKQKESELRKRMEREMIKRELRNLDAVQLKSIEMDRKEEIANLARQRALLKQKEDALMQEVENLETRFTSQEKQFREQQSVVKSYFDEKMQEGGNKAQKEKMRLAQYRGQRSAELKVARAELIKKQKELLETAEKMNIDIDDGIANMAVPNVSAEDLRGREELQQIVADVQESLGNTQASFAKMKAEFNNDIRREEEEHSMVDAELATIVGPTFEEEGFKVHVEEIMGDWVSEQKLAEDEMAVSASSKPVGVVLDELDKIVAKTAPRQHASPPPAHDTLGSSMQSIQSTAGAQSPVPRGSPVPHGSPSPIRRSPTRRMSSQDVVETSASLSADIDALKREYYSSEPKDPNLLLQIQALERELYGIPDPPAREAGLNGGGSSFVQPQQPQHSDPFQQSHANTVFASSQQPPPFNGTMGAPMMGGTPYGVPPQMVMGPTGQPMMLAPSPMMYGNGGGGGGAQSVMMMMMLQQQQQQQQQQQNMQMEQLRRQNEDERRRMQDEMRALQQMKSKPSNQKREYQRMMSHMMAQLNGLNPEKEGGGSQGKDITTITEESMRALNMLPPDSKLYRIQMQHLEEITKMRFKMEEMAQNQQLFELEAKLKKAKIDQEKELEHDEFMADKRRQLRAARIQRILAKEMPGEVVTSGFSYDYDPSQGFTIFFDFARDVHARYKRLQLVYCFTVDQEQKTKVRAMPVAECEPDVGALQQCVVGMNRELKKVPAVPGSRCVIEVQSVGNGGVGQPGRVESVGWCAVELFSSDLKLNSGLHKLPLQRGQVNFHQLDAQSLPPTSHISVYVRLCTAADTATFKNMSLDPVIAHSKYSYPHYIQNIPQAGSPTPHHHKRAAGRRKNVRARPAPRSQAKVETPARPASPPPAPSPDQPPESPTVKAESEAPASPAPAPVAVKMPTMEWATHGLGIKIVALENSDSALDAETVHVQTSLRGKDGAPVVGSDGKPIVFATERNGPIDEGEDLFSFEYGSMNTFTGKDVASISPDTTYAVFEVMNELNEVLGWNAVVVGHADGQIQKGENELPILVPPVTLPPETGQLSEQDKESVLIVELYNPKTPPAEKGTEDNQEKQDSVEAPKEKVDPAPAKEEEAKDEAEPATQDASDWFIKEIKGARPASAPIFVPGDGFDVYVDGARYLPSNTTLSRFNLKVMTAGLKNVKLTDADGKPSPQRETITKIAEDAYLPMWNVRAEYRDSSFDTTSAIMIRVDAIEEGSKNIEVIGYACLNVFCLKESVEAPTANGEECVLNEGGHQIPIYYGAPDQKKSWGMDNLKSHDKVPCATLLVRILPAKRDAEGKVMSSSQTGVSEDEMFVPAPPYSSRYYDSSHCIPSVGEEAMYKYRYNLADVNVAQRAQHAKRENEPQDDWESKSDKELQTWVNMRMAGKPTDILSPSRIAHYNKDAGFFFRCDFGYNLKFPSAGLFAKAGEVTKVMYTICPPASRFIEGQAKQTYMTLKSSWKSAFQNQEYKDEKRTYNIEYSSNACLIIEVKGLAYSGESKKKKAELKTSSLGWAIVPVFMPSMVDDQTGHVISGLFQVPLFEGVVPKALVQEIHEGNTDVLVILERELSKSNGKYKLKLNDSGAQILVKLLDCQLFSMAKTFLKTPSTRYIPVGKEKVFAYDKKKWKGDAHNLSKAIPKGRKEEDFEAELNKMFAGHFRLLDAGVEGWQEFVPEDPTEKKKGGGKAEAGEKKKKEGGKDEAKEAKDGTKAEEDGSGGEGDEGKPGDAEE